MAIRKPTQEQQAAAMKPLMSLEEVAVILGCSYVHVDKYVRQGKIPSVHIGALVRVRPESLEKLLGQVERGEVTL